MTAAEKRQQIEALLHAGHSDLEVHRRTGADRNTVARYRKKLGLPGYKAREDSPTCSHGHPYPENAVRGNDGWLRCRACMRASSRAAQQRRSSQAPKRQTNSRAPRQRAYMPGEPDEVAIERAVAGDPPERLTPRERAAAIRQLERRELSAAAIAERVRCTPRTVHRHRAAA